MTTAIEDSELEAELQELYLVNKQCLSDLEFLDTELEFLRKLAAINSVDVTKNEQLNNLDIIENTYKSVKKDILAYLHQLEPLIIAKTKLLDLALIERYVQLKKGLAGMFAQCQKLKKEIFEVSKGGIIEANDQSHLNDTTALRKNSKRWREPF